MKKLVIDLDDTLTAPGSGDYATRRPRKDVIEKLRTYRDAGFVIQIHTARNMRTHDRNIGLINVHTLPGILQWLADHDVPFDEVTVGKPWCGSEGFYVDDRAVRPDEFASKTLEEIQDLLRRSLPAQES